MVNAGGEQASPAAEAALARANAALEAGRFAEAAAAFDETAALERAAGRDEALEALRFAATCWRLAGRPEESIPRAREAADAAQPGSPAHVAARTEGGEARQAPGDAAGAASAYGDALRTGADAGMPAAVRAALLRRRAAALAAAGRGDAAVAALREAHDLHRRLGDPHEALQARVEESVYLQAASDRGAAARVAGAARRVAARAGDHATLADLDLLEAARALERRDLRGALAAARRARRESLAADDPMRYTGAALAVAELAEVAGEREAAYESLAVGLVTLADRLGRELARLVFEPPLIAQRERWGASAFAAVKGAYEQRRRAELGTERSSCT
jgi:hypothetical protein